MYLPAEPEADTHFLLRVKLAINFVLAGSRGGIFTSRQIHFVPIAQTSSPLGQRRWDIVEMGVQSEISGQSYLCFSSENLGVFEKEYCILEIELFKALLWIVYGLSVPRLLLLFTDFCRLSL